MECELVQEIPKVPESVLRMSTVGCISLARFPNNIVDFISCDDHKEYYEDGEFKQLILMNCDIPDWYSYKSMNNSITFLLPADYASWKSKAFVAPCVKFQVLTNVDVYFELECKVFINDSLVWHEMVDPIFEEEWRKLDRRVSPGEYMWLIVLDPTKHFQPYWDDIMDNKSLEIDLNQPGFGINSSQSIWNKFTVSFEFPTWSEDGFEVISIIKSCGSGVHVIMEGYKDY